MARRKKGNPVNGWINLYKPLGMTSNQALGAVKRALNPQKAGHAGTLDPLASGILPIALGEATKTVPYVQDAMKSYRFTVTWGEERTTDDAEGEVAATSPERPAHAAIEALLPAFHGDVEQTPPQFSAIKINGARAYDIARGGEVAEIASRLVYIDRLEIAEQADDDSRTTFTCDCGKGTYVRAIARDLGRKLGCYGYVSLLERTAVGGMTLDNAISLDILQNLGDKPPECGYLMPLTTALDDIPVLALRQDEAARLKNGQALFFSSRPDFARLEAIGMDQGEDGAIALATFEGDALAMVALEGPEIKPVRLFNF